MKKTIKRIAIFGIVAILIFLAICSILIGLTYIFSEKVDFDINKIKYTSSIIEMYDKNNCPIKDASIGSNFVKLNTLNKYTVDAFIYIEDKEF